MTGRTVVIGGGAAAIVDGGGALSRAIVRLARMTI
ncbi:hypothetical protein GGR48_002393 [Sphingomonas pseudosanguinis]|uniref:Uncharacterized protein n=1 Tax=Sphingomonas pseudosanguinis TaxID=413712 RepID=A0A7W6F3E9_9SPHN|nr:hypothetical protein [Sphingomonas pseudosanguinis]